MEAAGLSETSVNFCEAIQCSIPKDCHMKVMFEGTCPPLLCFPADLRSVWSTAGCSSNMIIVELY